MKKDYKVTITTIKIIEAESKQEAKDVAILMIENSSPDLKIDKVFVKCLTK